MSILTVCASGCDFTKIQDAINAASSGDTILIRAGTYKENLTGVNGITLQGEGASNTIIDGDGIDSVIVDGEEFTVSDVSLTGGKTNGFGGAVGEYGSDGYTIRNSILSNNRAKSGGAVWMDDWTINIINCVLINNKAKLDGGAILATGSGSSIVLRNSIVINNRAGRNGGGISLTGFPADIAMTKSIVTKNTARQNGGGIYTIGEDMDTASDSVISKNRAIKGSGGGIYAVAQSFELNNTYITGNRARRKGGGIYSTREGAEELIAPTIEVKEGKIVSNCARRGGGIFNDEFSELSINDSHIVKNRAKRGGGILNRGTVTIDSDSIVSLNKRTNCVGC